MRYIVSDNLARKDQLTASRAILLRDGWDDWFKFRTLFSLVVFDHDGIRHDIGQLKIGQVGLKPARTTAPGQRSPEVPDAFEVLDDQFFSLGQDESYYETLRSLGDDVAASILVALRDCALNLDIFRAARSEEVMSESLLRSVSAANVMGKLHRLAKGIAKLTSFHFEYKMSETGLGPPSPNLEFKVIPNGVPPTNVHVIIGRNGAGKTRLLQSLARSTLDPNAVTDEMGTLTLHEG